MDATDTQALVQNRGNCEDFDDGHAYLQEDFSVQCTTDTYVSPEHERALQWNDPDLGIDWGIDAPLLSPKDAVAGSFADFESPF